MIAFTLQNRTARVVTIARMQIPPRGSVQVDAALFGKDAVEGGTLLSMHATGVLAVLYQGRPLDGPSLLKFLSVPTPNPIMDPVIGASRPVCQPIVWDTSQYAVSVDNITNASGAALTVGTVVRLSDSLEMVPALADSLDHLRPALGVLTTASVPNGGEGTVQLSGARTAVFFEQGLTLLGGDPVFVSATNAGRLTNIPPQVAGQVIQEMGTALDVSAYNPVAPSPVATILIRPQDPIVFY